MLIEKIAISELNPAPYNPRTDLKPGDPAYDRLKASIEEFDLVEPLVWNRRTGNLVGGHQRLKILKARGDVEVEVVVVDLPADREKALNVALNNPNLSGDWDLEKLTSVIDELRSVPDFDLTLTGFSDADLKGLLFEPQTGSALPNEEQVEPSDRIEVQLRIESGHWEEVRAALDDLVDRHGIECHVRFPSEGA